MAELKSGMLDANSKTDEGQTKQIFTLKITPLQNTCHRGVRRKRRLLQRTSRAGKPDDIKIWHCNTRFISPEFFCSINILMLRASSLALVYEVIAGRAHDRFYRRDAFIGSSICDEFIE